MDYSEADLFYCGAEKKYHRTCANGWNLDEAADYIGSDGVVDEACFPYTPGDQPCNLCADWQNRKKKFPSKKITDKNMMKEWISTNYPLTTAFTIYSDFFSYSRGVYSPTPDSTPVTGHTVSVVGYEDNMHPVPYWICKNSWGPDFGEKGFFRIQQGMCGIDYEMWAILPHPPGSI